uniref:FF domain-containing protein n=1 Tax=Periophthalmus magnuspinnatus TaxID=409849 RepID=A0A3B4AGA2_9GOBI
MLKQSTPSLEPDSMWEAVRERFLKEPAFEDITLESERKRIFKDFMHVLEHECQHHHSKTKKHSKKSKKHHRKRSRSRSVSAFALTPLYSKIRPVNCTATHVSDFCASGVHTERSYKKSKKHKKKAKKRRHKSVSNYVQSSWCAVLWYLYYRIFITMFEYSQHLWNAGDWDTSGSELSEGELEKRRRTLLEQLDAP